MVEEENESRTMHQKVDEQSMQHVRKRPRRFYVHVTRDPKVQNARLELPVCMHEQEIIEAIHAHDVVLITGATGTGKTTQVPQFLVEDGFGDPNSPSFKGTIGVTQPRRVAAVTCAKRVAFEMKTAVGKGVGYQIRHESKVGPEMKIKFATDGILLREAEDDILLRKYSAIIIDEVHERSLNTDLLLSFLSRTVVMRRSKETELGRLKLIIMSATLDVQGVFAGEGALFSDPPVIKVPSRQFPVTTHFAKKTTENYVEESFKKVSKIHRRLPPGGVLVFLSGRQEVDSLCLKVKEEFGEEKIKIPDCDHPPIGIRVLPFYALLPDHLQRRVFEDPGNGIRKVVVATNVAETSVTIPGIAYVVDSGRVKEKVFKGSGSGLLTSYEVRWVSQAAAEQRTGRAGRTGPGHCYRLYSSAVYDQQFEKYRQPEILRVPADTVVLRLRAMGILHVSKFPFPTKPNEGDISVAEDLLTELGALYRANAIPSLKLDPKKRKSAYHHSNTLLGVTSIGRSLAKLPLPPRIGKILLSASASATALPYACRLAAVLTVGTVLDKAVPNFKERQSCLRNRKSDLMTELAAVCAAEYAGQSRGLQTSDVKRLDISAMRTLCDQLGIHLKSVLEALAITKQVERMLLGSETRNALKPPDKRLQQLIFRSLLSGFPDRVARRMTRHEAATRGVIPKRQKIAFSIASQEDPVFLEGSSSVHLDSMVEFVCFSDLVEVQTPIVSKENEEDKDDYEESEGEEEDNDDRKSGEKPTTADSVAQGYESEKRIVMRGATVVESGWVAEEATSMCNFRKGKDGPEVAKYDKRLETVVESVAVSYGKHHWPLGTKGVPVSLLKQLYGEDVSAERKRDYCHVFARALVRGSIRSELKLELSVDAVEVCVRALVGILEKHDVYDVVSLKMMVRYHGDKISDTVEACAGKRNKDAGIAWRTQLQKLGEEEETSELEAAPDDEDEDGRE